MRSLFRPASYLGVLREALLTSVHVTTYPLGLLPPLPFRHEPAGPTIPRRPVILLHGWVHNRSAFLLMQRVLRRAGLGPVHTFDYPSVTSDLSQVARHLAPVVEKVVDHTRADSCVLVGHSMGGLVARQYVQELGGHDLVDTVITMGTPHRGTYSAWLGVGRAAEQCRPGSDYLTQLERTSRPGLARWISYYSDLDFMITPAISAKLLTPELDATNVRIRDIGHLSLLLSRSVLADLLTRLEEHGTAA
ncbi:MAG TPA: alpha/beta fold hydrolase [Euzebyales bacterium]|nr:alpha/beta fold hydrolase [Euzebyales bacterium]